MTITDVNNTALTTGTIQILSDKIIHVQGLDISSFVTGPNEITIKVENRNNDDAKLVTNFIILS